VKKLLLALPLLLVSAWAREPMDCGNRALILSQDMTLDPWYHHNIVTLLALGGTRYTITEAPDETYLTLIVNGSVPFCREKHDRIFVFQDRDGHKHKFWVTGMMMPATPNPAVSASNGGGISSNSTPAVKPNPLPAISANNSNPLPVHVCTSHFEPDYSDIYDGVVSRPTGTGITPPRALYAPDPEYSDEARQAKFQGVVVLWLIVGPDGKPRSIRVSRQLGCGLDQKAVEAVKRWRFEPALKDGKPVAVQINVEVNFRLY
jgi:TonB family protein